MLGVMEAFDLRSRHADWMAFVDFHLVVDGAMTVGGSHAICDRIGAALKADHPDRVFMHVEPAAKRKCGAMEIARTVHVFRFLALAVLGQAPAFLAGLFDPKSFWVPRSRLSGTDPSVWRDKPAADVARREQRDKMPRSNPQAGDGDSRSFGFAFSIVKRKPGLGAAGGDTLI